MKSRPKMIMEKRNLLLSESDWTLLNDSPLSIEKKTEWAIYRQALRDLPAQENFPRSIQWPVKPS
jgi:Phage tail assembly chaperone protein